MSKVYILKSDGDSYDTDSDSRKLLKVISEKFDSQDDLAIKLHFGERNNDTYLNPEIVESIYKLIERKVNDCALMDCNVLYKSERSFGTSHKELAKANGFGFAPIMIADGEEGDNETLVEVNLNHFDEAKIGGKLDNFNSLLAITHFTGHRANGMGGALKNVGMGLGSKGGKLRMHEAFDLEVNREECEKCGKCARICSADCIEIESEGARIDKEKCIGCGKCIAICPVNAINIPWGANSSKELQERIVEYAYGVLKDRKSYFITVLFNVTPECDCIREKQDPMIEDIGILLSDDIVAIDQAALDLVGDDSFEDDSERDIQIRYAEELGLGEREYQLIEI